MTEHKAPRTLWGFRRRIVSLLKANRSKNYIDWGTRSRIWYLSTNQTLRLYVMLHGPNGAAVIENVNDILSDPNSERVAREMRAYLTFHGVLLAMCDLYKNNNTPSNIVKWLAFNGAECGQTTEDLKAYSALLLIMNKLPERARYSPISHASQLGNAGILEWVLKNHHRVGDVISASTATGSEVVTPGMVMFHTRETGHQQQGAVTAQEARLHLMECVGGGRKLEAKSGAIESLSDEEVASLYDRLSGPDGMSAHKTLRDIVADCEEEQIHDYLKLYSAYHDSLHSIAGTYQREESGPYEQMKWMSYNGIEPLVSEGYEAALEITGRLRHAYAPSPSTRISVLSKSGALHSAFEHPDAVDRIVALYNEMPERFIDSALLDIHTAVSDGWL